MYIFYHKNSVFAIFICKKEMIKEMINEEKIKKLKKHLDKLKKMWFNI